MSRVLVLGCPLILSRLIETRLQLNVQTFPKRPPRVPWVRGTPVFFVTFCTYRRRSMLATKNVHDSFIAFVLRAAQSHNLAVGRYVIMPDHIHLFVCGDLQFHLGKWIKSLKQALGKSISKDVKQDRIWQEGFFDHVLRSDESMSQKWDYIKENPARAGLVADSVDWSYQGEIV